MVYLSEIASAIIKRIAFKILLLAIWTKSKPVDEFVWTDYLQRLAIIKSARVFEGLTSGHTTHNLLNQLTRRIIAIPDKVCKGKTYLVHK